MRYSELCFNTKRNQDPDKTWIPGIPACQIIHELMRKLDLTSYLEVHSMKDAEKLYGEIDYYTAENVGGSGCSGGIAGLTPQTYQAPTCWSANAVRQC